MLLGMYQEQLTFLLELKVESISVWKMETFLFGLAYYITNLQCILYLC